MDPINHPEMLKTATATETNNIIKCESYKFKKFEDRNDYNQPWQWECKDIDSWAKYNEVIPYNLYHK